MDFEVYRVTQVMGYGTSTEEDIEFLPFYALTDMTDRPDHGAFYSVRRVPRLLSSKQRQYGARSGYVGSELFLSLVDARQSPYHHDLRQLGLNVLCTNRDLPLHIPRDLVHPETGTYDHLVGGRASFDESSGELVDRHPRWQAVGSALQVIALPIELGVPQKRSRRAYDPVGRQRLSNLLWRRVHWDDHPDRIFRLGHLTRGQDGERQNARIHAYLVSTSRKHRAHREFPQVENNS